MGSVFSSGALFQTPPALAPRRNTHRGSGIPQSTAQPSKHRNAFASMSDHGSLYSHAIHFRPGINEPVDAPQVAAQRLKLFASR